MTSPARRIGFVLGGSLGALALLATAVTAVSTTPTRDGVPPESDAVRVQATDLEDDTVFGDQHFIAGNAFHPESSGATHTFANGGCLDIGAGDIMAVNLDLPDEATIVAVQAHVYDDDVSSNVIVFLERYETIATDGGSAPTSNEIYTINSGDGDDSGYQTLQDSTSSPDEAAATIDNTTYTYTLLANGGNSSVDLCGVKIFYQYAASTALTFHQTEPCAAFDTRSGRGGRNAPLGAGETATFDLIMSDYSSQGGVSDTSGCTLPSGTSSGFFGNPDGTVAVLLNLVALNPAGSGNLKLWDDDETEPDGGVVVFKAAIANSNAVPIGVGDGNGLGGSNGGEVLVKNNSGSTVDVRGIVLGYYTTTPKNQE